MKVLPIVIKKSYYCSEFNLIYIYRVLDVTGNCLSVNENVVPKLRKPFNWLFLPSLSVVLELLRV